MKQKKKTVVYYLTSEKPTSKVRLLAFKTRSFVISSFLLFLKMFFMWKRVKDLKNSYPKASLSQAELMGITLLCQNPKKKLYTFPPTLLFSPLLYTPLPFWLKMQIFIFFFLLEFKGRKKWVLAELEVWGYNFVTQKKWSKTPKFI